MCEVRVLKRRLNDKKGNKVCPPLPSAMRRCLWQHVFGHAQSACFAMHKVLVSPSKKAKPNCRLGINKRSNSFQSL